MSYTVYGFTRPAKEEEELGICKKIKKILQTVVTNLKEALSFIPSLFLAIVFNIGTITLTITLLRWSSLPFFLSLFLSNVVLIYFVPLETFQMILENTNLVEYFPKVKTYPLPPKNSSVGYVPKVQTFQCPQIETNWHPILHGLHTNTAIQNALFMSFSNILFVSRTVVNIRKTMGENITNVIITP